MKGPSGLPAVPWTSSFLLISFPGIIISLGSSSLLPLLWGSETPPAFLFILLPFSIQSKQYLLDTYSM